MLIFPAVLLASCVSASIFIDTEMHQAKCTAGKKKN